MLNRLAAGATAALSVLVATVAPGAPANAQSASPPIRIVAFGDSLTAGYGLRTTEAFPARLQAALQAKGYNVSVANAGVSGDTTAAGLARVKRAVPAGTDITIVELGANDILRGIPPATAERNLDAVLVQTVKSSRAVILAGMIAPPGFRSGSSASFGPVYTRLATRHGATLYPFFLQGVAGQRALNLPDGIHPNAAGIQTIVDGILPTVLRELEGLGAGTASRT